MSNLQRTPPAVGGNKNNTPLTYKRNRMDYESYESTVMTGSDANDSPITLDSMMKMMVYQFAETRKLIDSVRTEIKDVNTKIDAVKADLKSDIQSVKDECASKFQHHDIVLESLNKRMDSVTHKLGALENRNELIISGVPSKPGEDLNSTLKAIGQHLEVKDTATRMVETRRLKSGGKSTSDGLIVAEFALKTSRDEFYSAYLRKRDLKLRHIGLDSDRRVYINESLTSEARKLKSAALHLKKAGKLASVYTKQGILHVKPTTTAPPIVIQTEKELEKYS